ncbi:hypothetical protein TNCT_369521 [Trichonephila clavata]|uniref:Uncharacterized protein n=1 Tax=Trichonephila clavata TaxID=2740835 RepID=A0A8X6F643_TRICU|nr:hypothetical protein TNCT_369521 [Trichonephila clavata]
MAFYELNVQSLRQMAMTKTAITLYRDPEILNFMKINGRASFVFPSKETYLLLKGRKPRLSFDLEKTWMWKDLLIENKHIPREE